jgi:hypothetical protein
MKTLKIDEKLTIHDLNPKDTFISTDIMVSPHEKYAFSATGKWKDWFKTCDANGWQGFGTHWLRRFARVSNADLFCLCGSFNKSKEHVFKIGSQREYTVKPADCVQNSAELFLFANDIPWMYWNNQKDNNTPLDVMILRLK